MQDFNKNILPIIRAALNEDIDSDDITTRLILPDKKIKARISAKEKGLICGLELARRCFQAVDRGIDFRASVKDGARVSRGEIIARLDGPAAGILKAERVALNFLGHLSGIAGKTNQYVRKVKPYRVKIMDTRKTTPGLRVLEKYAVRCGGGINHRMGLWDQVLIKDNHLSAISYKLSAISLKDLIKKAKRKMPRGMKLEVEVKNLRQFSWALSSAAEIIMLDNFSLRDIKKAVKMRNSIRPPLQEKPRRAGNTRYAIPELEVSGGVTINNLRKIASTGVERISIGALTHSVQALDIALNCE